MKLAMVVPPGGYFYTPYLAPYLLKGYLQASTAHRARVFDWNIRFELHRWGSDANQTFARLLHGGGDRVGALLAEMMAEHGLQSWRALRDESTFGDPRAVAGHSAVLGMAPRIGRSVDRESVLHGFIPQKLGAWDSLLEVWRGSVVGSFLEAHVVELREFDAVAISATYTRQLLPALLLAAAAKADQPSRPVIVGGGAITHFLPDLLRDPSFWVNVDHAIPFEGEYSLGQLLDGLAGTAPMPTLNVASRTPSGVPEYTPALGSRPHVQASPDFTDLLHEYPTPEPVMPLLTSKGCYWGKCGYCTHHEGYGQGFQRLDDDAFEASMRELVSAGHRAFYFVDEALPPRTMQRFVSQFLALQRRDDSKGPLKWMAEARLDRPLVTPDAVRQLKESGCRLLISGVETGSQRISDRMRRGIDLDLVARHAELCAVEGGISTGWMLFLGFPGESQEEARETFEFLQHNLQRVHYASIGTFSLERGSPIWHDPGAFGVSEIIEADAPYRAAYSYRLEGDLDMTTGAHHKALLTTLIEEYPEVRSLFDRAVDRALLLFVPPRPPGDCAPPAPGSVEPKTWRSTLENRDVAWWPTERKLQVWTGVATSDGQS